MADLSLRITVAVTGASGAIYALRTIRALMMAGVHIDLIVSEWGWMLLKEEGGFESKRADFREFLRERFGEGLDSGTLTQHGLGDLAASISSGSVRNGGMVVVPCSMKTLSGIANGTSGTLVERAADVTLKERRPLILVPRETPMNLIQLRNMVAVSEAGAILVPAMPAFYQNPQTFDDLADFIAGRILNLLDIPHSLFPTWKGE